MDYETAKRTLGLHFVDEDSLAEAFRKAVCRTHPDRGGSATEFKQVMDARATLEAAIKVAPTVSTHVSETEFVKRLTKLLESVGAMVFKIHGHAMQEVGWPDLQVYHREWTGHLEAKVGANPATKIQKEKIAKLRERGTKAGVIRLGTGRVKIDGAEKDLVWPTNAENLISWLRSCLQ